MSLIFEGMNIAADRSGVMAKQAAATEGVFKEGEKLAGLVKALQGEPEQDVLVLRGEETKIPQGKIGLAQEIKERGEF